MKQSDGPDVWFLITTLRATEKSQLQSTFTVPLNEYEPSICSDPMDKTTWYSTADVMEYSHQKPWYSTISGVNSHLAIY
jgi:hypothetical protein